MQQPSSREQRLAQAISEAMQSSGMDVRALAAATGMADTTLRRRLAEAGSLSYPEFCAIADALGADRAALAASYGGPGT